jgi:hypothetical protein
MCRMLKRIVACTFWSVYDTLGRLVLANLLWFALTLPWWALLYGLGRREAFPFTIVVASCALPIALLNPASAGLAATTQRLAQMGSTDLTTFWSGLRAHFFRALLLMGFGVLTTMILGSAIIYYLGRQLAALGDTGNMAGAIGAGCVAIVVAATACYWMPVAVGVPGKRPELRFVLTRSWSLSVRSPGLTLGVLALTVLGAVFWAATVVGVVVLGMSVVSVFHAQAREMLRDRDEVVAEHDAEGGRLARRDILAALESKWAQEPQRNLRDLAGLGRSDTGDT